MREFLQEWNQTPGPCMCHSYTLTPATVFNGEVIQCVNRSLWITKLIIRSNASAMKELWPHCQRTCWTRKRGWMRVDFHTTCFRTCQKSHKQICTGHVKGRISTCIHSCRLNRRPTAKTLLSKHKSATYAGYIQHIYTYMYIKNSCT